MNKIETWGKRWNIPVQAINELKMSLGVFPEPPPGNRGESETMVQSRVRLEASQKGLRLWRNNVGACYDADGNFIRYGLCNDSKKMNDAFKSADLVGIRPITIDERHIGMVLGQFIAREMKRGDWRYTNTKREKAQLNFINLINSMGGDAQFCQGEGTL